MGREWRVGIVEIGEEEMRSGKKGRDGRRGWEWNGWMREERRGGIVEEEMRGMEERGRKRRDGCDRKGRDERGEGTKRGMSGEGNERVGVEREEWEGGRGEEGKEDNTMNRRGKEGRVENRKR